ncbi:hypothetical protein VNO77_43073 [Canavalia gladiata]|uniref:pectinesterase n=1 Tax=Canavalia gladiata TaxID=3824 RepID=A0AAN9JVU4_CANGL
MQHSHIVSVLSFLFVILIVSDALDCSNPPKVIYVNPSGNGGSFKTIQSAINSLPKPNTQWAHIRIAAGIYREVVFITRNRPCIFLEGAGSSSTIMQASGHGIMATSFTFGSIADDLIVKGIGFENMYSDPYNVEPLGRITPALAVKIEGDRNAFYGCSFKSVQDTLWDRQGRHYFRNCYFQGGVDFIFGDGQSIYERSVMNFTMGPNGIKGMDGTITAQKRESANSTTGYVIKNCHITGIGGRVIIGRAYGPYSRVIVANSKLDDVIRPEGWSIWNQAGHEADITYVEAGNSGRGADTSKRVSWMKKMDPKQLNTFLSLSYINKGGWIEKQPGFQSFLSSNIN